MKRRFAECAVLLGIIMSVMLLAQTQDGLGHSKNMHDPLFYLGSDGKSIGDDESGADPRGLDFSVTNGTTCLSNGCNHAHTWGEGWYYRGGLLNGANEDQTNDPTNIGHPTDDIVQQIYTLKVRADCYAYLNSCSATVSPSLDNVDALPKRDQDFQGNGTISLELSTVDYHEVRGFWRAYCVERRKEGPKWGPKSEIIAIKVRMTNYATTRSGNWGGNISIGRGNISAGYSHSYKQEHNNLHGRGFGICVGLNTYTVPGYMGSEPDPITWKQDKYVWVEGNVQSAHSGQLGTVYPGFDNHKCPGLDSGSQ